MHQTPLQQLFLLLRMQFYKIHYRLSISIYCPRLYCGKAQLHARQFLNINFHFWIVSTDALKILQAWSDGF